MHMVKFFDLEVDPTNLVKPHGRRAKHAWGKHWTRIQVEIPEQHTAPGKIAAWIEENLSGGLYGLFYKEDKNNPSESQWEKNYILIIGFEDENDAIMFKLLDGHKAYEDDEPL